MKRALIIGGIVTVMVGLGFVCPQLANLRESGSLIASQAALLGLGITISAAGGFRWRPGCSFVVSAREVVIASSVR